MSGTVGVLRAQGDEECFQIVQRFIGHVMNAVRCGQRAILAIDVLNIPEHLVAQIETELVRCLTRFEE